MDKFFNPGSVAVIGVSEKPTNMAKNVVMNLQEFEYNGIIYAVGVHGGRIAGRRIYKTVADIPDQVDLAVLLTPADTIADILEECGQKGIKNAVIESAGFREFGEEGKVREKRVVAIAKKYGIRFIGPNCIGTMNLNSGLVLPFIRFKEVHTHGKVSVVSQSGGVALTFLNLLSSENIGISKVASVGNKLDVDENDLIEYLVNDDDTDIILVYLEGISDGRRLLKIAENSEKPILVHKANIGQLGQSIAASHTAALSSDDAVVSAALNQSGIARFYDRATLVNYLKVLPLPKVTGNNLAIISRSGGHAILAADAAEQSGFQLAPFSESFLNEIASHFRANVINLTNPLDLGDLFDYDLYVKIIEKTVKQKNVDGVVFLHTYFSSTEAKASRELIVKMNELSEKYKKPIGICVATDEAEIAQLRKDLKGPIFNSPLEIIKALALARDFFYGIHPRPKEAHVKADIKSVKSRFQSCRSESRSPLLQEGLEIFKSYKIPVIGSRWVTSAEEAAQASEELGYPAVIKVVSRAISHKTDIGGVDLNLKNSSQVKEAYEEMMETITQKMPGADIEGVVVQPMLKRGWEMILGAKNDPNFGPVVLVGLGGIFVEVFKDTSIRVAPFCRREAKTMLSELKGYPILQGARGGKKYDIDSVIDSILNLSQLISDFPEIAEIDINPFYVLPEGEGGMALDARIILSD
ncbi:MAG: acetate--CoA ligase family protein [Deltaproteobacteria bacterium]|nr:acetate--CoA ligase family protein [Deltaproteobacteria bacterium]